MFRKASDSSILPNVFPTFLKPSLPFRLKSRQSSADSTGSTSSHSSSVSRSTISTQSSNPFSRCPTPVPVPPLEEEILEPTDKFLHAHRSHIQCAKCSTDLALTSQIISKGFTGRHGRAYLVQGTRLQDQDPTSIDTSYLPNTYPGKAVPRSLVTGQHTVSDVSCAICTSLLGWKYIGASEESQKYKVGKFILETKKIRVAVTWEHSDTEDGDATQWEEVGPLSNSELRRIADASEKHPSGGISRGRAKETICFDSQDEDECEDLFAGVWSTTLARKRRQRKRERMGRKAQKVAVSIPLGSSRESLALASVSRESSRPVSRRT